MTDYRTLLGKAIQQHPYPMDAADFLATRIPWLCPDCEGSGVNRKAQAMNNALAIELFLKPEFRMSEVCTHPNALTIADLLRWGEKEWRAQANASQTAVDLHSGTENESGEPNPYKFTVKLSIDEHGAWVDLKQGGRYTDMWEFNTEAEAREHARLIVAALKAVTVE